MSSDGRSMNATRKDAVAKGVEKVDVTIADQGDSAEGDEKDASVIASAASYAHTGARGEDEGGGGGAACGSGSDDGGKAQHVGEETQDLEDSACKVSGLTLKTEQFKLQNKLHNPHLPQELLDHVLASCPEKEGKFVAVAGTRFRFLREDVPLA